MGGSTFILLLLIEEVQPFIMLNLLSIILLIVFVNISTILLFEVTYCKPIFLCYRYVMPI